MKRTATQRVKSYFTNQFTPSFFLLGTIIFSIVILFIHLNIFKLDMAVEKLILELISISVIGFLFIIVFESKDVSDFLPGLPWIPVINAFPLILIYFSKYNFITYLFWSYIALIIVYCIIISASMEEDFNIITFLILLWTNISGFIFISLRLFDFGEIPLEPIRQIANSIIDIRIVLSLISLLIIVLPAIKNAYKIIDLAKFRYFVSDDFFENTPLKPIVDVGNTLIWILILTSRFMFMVFKNIIEEIINALSEFKTLIAVSLSLFILFYLHKSLSLIFDSLVYAANQGSCGLFRYSYFDIAIQLLIFTVVISIIFYYLNKSKYLFFLTCLLYCLCFIITSCWCLVAFSNILSTMSSYNGLINFTCLNQLLVFSSMFILLIFAIIFIFGKYKEKYESKANN